MEPVRFLFTSGHSFGSRFLRGILSSNQFRHGEIMPVQVLALHPRHAIDTAGYEDMGFISREFGVPIEHFDDVKEPKVQKLILAHHHSFHFVVGLSQLMPQIVLEAPAKPLGAIELFAPNYGVIGVHPTLLPEGRGRAPIPWTILHAKKQSGVSVFFLTREADAGPIIDQEPFDVEERATSSDIFERVAGIHELLGGRIARRIADQNLEYHSQSVVGVTNWQKRTRRDSWIDFNQPAGEIERLVRAVLPPYPPAFFVCGNLIVQVLRVEVLPAAVNAQPGEIVFSGADRVVEIAAKDSTIRLKEYRVLSGLNSLSVGTVITTSAEHGVTP